jgi:hypothetical protein
MKYAITGPAGRIFQVLDEPTAETKQITNAQANTVRSSKDPIFLINGELKTQAEAQVIRRAEQKAARIAAMTPEELAEYQQREAIQAAYATARATFETMPLGKQALWEPVRARVAEAILSGNIATAIEILQTTPVIYSGAEADRDAFLALFQ